MGQLDQFAKETFAMEVPDVTHGAAAWQIPAALNMSEVRIDGVLMVHDAAALAPWSTIGRAGEPVLVVEIKMPGDHVDMIAVDRAVLRRQALQVLRREDPNVRWEGETPLVVAAPHLPAVLGRCRTVEPIAPGCHRIGPLPFPFLWVAANELPLVDELIPFLIARTGRALDEFCLWVMTRRPPWWLARMVEFLSMSDAVYNELIRFVVTKTDDPAVEARKRRMVRVLVDNEPEVKQEIVDEARLEEGRGSLRRILALRNLPSSAEDVARINACTDLATLRRWLDQAVVAGTATEALR